jgi:hypothetical protein
VGSAPSCLDNKTGFIDDHDVVVRVNNYKTYQQTGYRTDVHYSFYGRSIKKTSKQLLKDGVYLSMCKCPNTQFIECGWHRENRKMNGVDFGYIYEHRRGFWFTDTYIPENEDFLKTFELLNKHVPTT